MKISNFKFQISNSQGFSVIEVVLAAALFMIFSTAAVIAILEGYNTNRLGAEETIANQFATEGIEAVKSIKNQAYSNLNAVNPTPRAVTRNASNVWAFDADGTDDRLTHNASDDYIRQVKVESVNRDGSGNIVSSGTNDPDTKKITSTVSWNFNSARPESVVLSTYLSDWRKPIPLRGGVLVYGNGGTTSDAIQYRILDGTSGTWGAESLAGDVDVSTNRALRAARVYASPMRNEKILLSRHYNGTTQYIYAQVFNGIAWGNVNLLASWTASTFLDVRNFDGTYLNNGDFMVVYSDNTKIPKFKTWDGSIWSTASGIAGTATQNIDGIPNYIALRNRPGTNEAMAAFFDKSRDTNTQYFYIGSNNIYETADWTLHAQHSGVAPTNTKEHIDFAWSPQNSLKGALIFSSTAGDKTINIKIWAANGSGSGTWSSTADSPTSSGKLGAMSLDGRTRAEEFIACQKDEDSDIYCFRANTTPAWTTPVNNILATSDSGIQRSFDFNFEATSGIEGVTVYSDTTSTPQYREYDASSNSFGVQNPLTSALDGILTTIKQKPLQDNGDILVLMADDTNTLYTVVWNGSSNAAYTSPSGKALSTHGTNGSDTTEFWYDFAWDRF